MEAKDVKSTAWQTEVEDSGLNPSDEDLFRYNKTGAIKNPLAGINKDALSAQIEAYADQFGLQDIVDLLRRESVWLRKKAKLQQSCAALFNCSLSLEFVQIREAIADSTQLRSKCVVVSGNSEHSFPDPANSIAVNIVAFYSSTIFVQGGFSEMAALWVSWGYSMTALIFAIPALYTIDRYGRRTLLISTFPHMFWTLLATGLSFLASSDQAKLTLVAFFTFLFAAFYCSGEGPCAFVYSAEAFPLSHPEIGMAWAVATNNFWAFVLSLTFPRMLKAFGATGSFGFYAGLNIIALIFIFLCLPETKERSLEELGFVFAVPTTRHASYQLNEVLPWWLKRYIFLDESGKKPELYHFE